MSYFRNDFQEKIEKYRNNSGLHDRYSSFDYCYNYFYSNRGKKLLKDREKSCLALGFYLASWGMFRGSSFLLQTSLKHFDKTIEHISKADPELWEIDASEYSDTTIDKLQQEFKDLSNVLVTNGKSNLTIVTKVMLGVYGATPAFDSLFTKSMSSIFPKGKGFSSQNLSGSALRCIKEFYKDNKIIIDNYSRDVKVWDFKTEGKTNLNYPKIKIIDMYGFIDGGEKVSIERKNKKQNKV